MFGTQKTRGEQFGLANWEAEIKHVRVQPCDNDPTGYRVIFYQMSGRLVDKSVSLSPSYEIGASFLKNRLQKLSRAGFDAPMTRKALDLLAQENKIRSVA